MTFAWIPDSKGAATTEPLGALWVEGLRSPRVLQDSSGNPTPRDPGKKWNLKLELRCWLQGWVFVSKTFYFFLGNLFFLP